MVFAREELPHTVRFWRQQGFAETARRPPYVELARRCRAGTPCRPPTTCGRSATRVAGLLRAGDVLVLSGDLGAGKTTFTQGLGAALAGAGSRHVADVRDLPGAPVAGRRARTWCTSTPTGSAVRPSWTTSTSTPTWDRAITVVEWGEGLAEDLADRRLDVGAADPRCDAPDETRERSDRPARVRAGWASTRGWTAAALGRVRRPRCSATASLDACCSPSTPRRRRSPWPCTTAPTWSPSWCRPRPCGTASSCAARRPGAAAGRDHGPRPDRDRGRGRSGTVHRAAGRAGLCPHDGLRAADPGLRRVRARRARGRGGRRRHRVRAVRGGHRRAAASEVYLGDVRRSRRSAPPDPTCSVRPRSRVVGRAARGGRRCRALSRCVPRRAAAAAPGRRVAGAVRRRGAGRAARSRTALPPPSRRGDPPRPPESLVS